MDIDGNNRTKLTSETVNYVIADGSSIYYGKCNDDGIFKMDLNGDNETKIYDEDGFINVNGNYIYFSLRYGGIYRMGLNGENVVKLSECNIRNYINVIGNSVYFADLINKDSGNIYKMNIDGTNKIKL